MTFSSINCSCHGGVTIILMQQFLVAEFIRYLLHINAHVDNLEVMYNEGISKVSLYTK